MSNENNSVQNSTNFNNQTNQPIHPESETEVPEAPKHLESVALGSMYFWKIFEYYFGYGLISGIVIGVLTCIFPPLILLIFPVAFILIFLSVLNWYRSMRCFCQTPGNIFPNASKRIIKSWSMIIAGLIICNIGYFMPKYCNNIHFLIGLILSACGLYCFYSFLSVVGEKTLPSKKGCRVATILLTISYTMALLYIIVMHYKPNFFTNNYAFFTILGLGFVALITLLIYIDKLNKYFSQFYDIKKLQKKDFQNEFEIDMFITAFIIVAICVYNYALYSLKSFNVEKDTDQQISISVIENSRQTSTDCETVEVISKNSRIS